MIIFKNINVSLEEGPIDNTIFDIFSATFLHNILCWNYILEIFATAK